MRKIKQQDLVDSSIPKKYWDASLFTVEINEMTYSSFEKLYKYINNLKYSLDNGIGILLQSGYVDFTGKTYIACFLAKFLLVHSKDCLYIKFSDLIQYHYQDYKIFQSIINKFFLIIDDVTHLTEKEHDILDKVMTHRYNNSRSTCIILNNMLLTTLSIKTQNIIENAYYNIDLSFNTKKYTKKL